MMLCHITRLKEFEMCSPERSLNVLLLSGRYGRVQSVKVLAKNKEDEVNTNGLCATIAFIDIKSASKAHSGDNKVDERTLKTEYYEPISTTSSAIHIHERNETLARPPAAGTAPASHYARSSSNSRYSHGYVFLCLCIFTYLIFREKSSKSYVILTVFSIFFLHLLLVVYPPCSFSFMLCACFYSPGTNIFSRLL